MTDLLIERNGSQWGLVLRDGDLVLTEDEGALTEVTQRVVYRLMTWSGESVYDRTAGLPYADGIFGSSEAEGIAGLFFVHVLETEGVDEITSWDFNLVDRELSLSFAIRVGGEISETIDVVITP